MGTNNICFFTPVKSIPAINERLKLIQRDLCYAMTVVSAPITAANNGLSIATSTIVLGQNVGEVGNPAALSSSREIPMNSFELTLKGSTGSFNVKDNGQVAIVGPGGSSTPALSVTSSGNTRFRLDGTTNVGMNIRNNSALSWTVASYQANTGNFDFVFYNDQNSVNSFFIDGNTNNMAIGFTTPTAKIHLPAGTATANTAPIKLTSGVNLTTAETGALEYNGTNLFFTRTGTTRETVWTGNSGASAPATGTGGLILNWFGTDITTICGNPNAWASVVIGGTTYKIPLYT